MVQRGWQVSAASPEIDREVSLGFVDFLGHYAGYLIHAARGVRDAVEVLVIRSRGQ